MKQAEFGTFASWLARHHAFTDVSSPIAVVCDECGCELTQHTPGRVEVARDEPIFYCDQCWEREFGIGAPAD